MQRIADPALTPAYEALTIPPFMRAQCTIATWLTSTAVTEDFNVGITNPVVALRTLGIASVPRRHREGRRPIVVSGSIPKRHIDLDDYDALMAATGVHGQGQVDQHRRHRRDGLQVLALAGVQQRPVRRRPAQPAHEPAPPRRHVRLEGRLRRHRRLLEVDARQRDHELRLMARRPRGPLAIAELAPRTGIEVDLWGVIFNAVPITRTLQRELDELNAAFQDIDEDADDADDQAVEMLASMLDVHVKPAGGRKKKASDFIVEKWKGDELTVEQLLTFQQRLVEAVRPT
jgi:hypothetical protein